MERLNNAFTLFLSLMVEAFPFLLLGVLFSSLLLVFVDERRLVAILPKNPVLGAIMGSLIGCVFPVCECGNVPVARRLIMQGAPSSVAVGFLLAAPTINPIVFASTKTAFRDQPEIVFLRFGISLMIAILVGLVFSVQKDLRPILQPSLARMLPRSRMEQAGVSPLLQSGTFILGSVGQPLRMDTTEFQGAILAANTVGKSAADRWNLLLENMIQELRELGSVLVLGSAIAALIQVFAPREVILSLGQGPVTSILAMMTLAAVVSICSTVDAFFALSFASTFTTGSLLSFLVFGPMIDLKGIGLMLSIFQTRAVVYLFGLAGLLTFLSTLFLNLYVS
ncbi:MAG: permease [Leptolyngbyaceae cyanobacterium bins.59]|nr:permease [Leptolyngbyaceae cyanobacterium bins.59]